jgi:hypothetical protein
MHYSMPFCTKPDVPPQGAFLCLDEWYPVADNL